MKLRRDQPYGYNPQPKLGGFVPDLPVEGSQEREPTIISDHQPTPAPLAEAVQVIEALV